MTNDEDEHGVKSNFNAGCAARQDCLDIVSSLISYSLKYLDIIFNCLFSAEIRFSLPMKYL